MPFTPTPVRLSDSSYPSPLSSTPQNINSPRLSNSSSTSSFYPSVENASSSPLSPYIELVQALHDYSTEEPTCLSLVTGDIIQVHSKDNSGWWDGICNGKRGWFPSNFVAPVSIENSTTYRTPDRESSEYSGSSSSSALQTQSPSSALTTPSLSPNKYSGNNFFGTSQDHSLPASQDDLPAPWRVKNTSEGQVYYFNPQTNQTVWLREEVERIALTVANGNAAGGRKPVHNMLEKLNDQLDKLQQLGHSPIGSQAPSSERTRNQPIQSHFERPKLNSQNSAFSVGHSRMVELQQKYRSGPVTWDVLINEILTVISELNHAAKNDEKAKFTPYTNAVVAAVHRMFLCSGNLWIDSPLLQQHKNLRSHYLAIRSALSKLNLACFVASGLWPPPDAVNKMRFQAGQVLLSIRHFVSVAHSIPIELYEPDDPPMIKSSSWADLLDDEGTKLCDAEIMSKINQSSDGIVSHVAGLVGRITQEGRTSGALIEKAKDIVNEVGQLLSLLEDIRLADEQSRPGTTSMLPDFLAKKDTLYVAVNDLVTSARTTMDAFAPPNALQLLMASATAVLKAVEELVVSAKLLIDQREGMELLRLQDHVAMMDFEEKRQESDLGVLQRRAMSLTLLHPPESGNSSDPSACHPESVLRTLHPPTGPEQEGGSSRNASEATSENSTAPQSRDDPPQRLFSKKKITQRSATSTDFSGRSAKPSSDGAVTSDVRRNPAESSVPVESKATVKRVDLDSPALSACLNYDYGPNDVTFNLEGQVNGATFQALVERLTLHDKVVDPDYLTTFLLTFRCFATPVEFLNELIRRYSLKPSERLTPEELQIWTEKKLTPIRLRVFNTIKAWLESYYNEAYDPPILEPLQAFAAGPMAETLSSASSRILELIQRKTNQDPETSTSSTAAMANVRSPKMSRTKSYERFDVAPSAVLPSSQGPPPPPVVPKNFTSRSGISLLDIDPLEIARQITIMESRYYCAIRPCELINQEFSKKGSTVAVNVKAMSTLSTQLTGWVAETILRENDTKKRCGLIKHFIKISDRCLSLQNFNALMAVLCALNSSTIARLKKTWELLGKNSRATLENLRKATEHTRNYAEYRNRLKMAPPPCLPFLGLYLTDLTFTDDGNPKYRGGPGSKLVNFDKYTKSARIVHEIQRFQVPYNLTEVPEMQEYIRENLERAKNGGDVSELYRVSLLIEPRQDDGMDARLESMLMREGFL